MWRFCGGFRALEFRALRWCTKGPLQYWLDSDSTSRCMSRKVYSSKEE